ncbi:MAG TPA: hypothetical protein VIN75_18970 [Burkholderiaceae bacterium]
MRIASTNGATALQHDGVDYEADENGVFDVPHEVGQVLVRFPHWLPEQESAANRRALAAQAELDPAGLAARVRELEGQLASRQPSEGESEHLARIAELEAEVESAKAAKPAAKKTAAAKKADDAGE